MYGYGDTFGYFNDAYLLSGLFYEDPIKGLGILFGSYEQFAFQFPNHFISWNNNNYTVVQLIFPLVLFGLKSYFPTTLLLSFITFISSWKLFEYFVNRYQELRSQIALVFLFIPSVIFWSSGILKDTICMASLSFLFVGFMKLFINHNYKVKYIITILICSYIIFNIKSYILLAFFPAMAIYITLERIKKIKNPYAKRLLLPSLLIIGIGVGYYSINSLAGQVLGGGTSAIEGAIQTGVDLQDAISSQDGGSSYKIEMQPTVFGLVLAAPKAISATLFRPYIWEANNILMIFTSIESSIMLFFTIFIIYKSGVIKTIKYISASPILIFSITFSIIFALFVGFSTGNFGTLVRYKIPCIPFYAIFLVLVLNKNKIPNNN